MNALSFLLLILCVGLLVALVMARRRLTEVSRGIPSAGSAPADDPALLVTAARVAPLGILIVDDAGRTVFENLASQAATAATGDNALVALRLRNLLTEASNLAEPIEQEVDLHGPIPRTVRIQAFPLFDAAQRLGTAAFIDDVTTRSQVDSMRSDFIANASHELKTPLGAMRLLAEALVATNDPDTARDLAEKIQYEAERINRLVEDILDLAILESVQPEPEDVDLGDVISDVEIQTRTFSEAVGIPVGYDCDPLVVPGDHRRLVSAVANLVENALNYSSIPGIETQQPIEVRVRAEGNRAVIEVEDHGIGIPERQQERIFERFYRIDRGRSRASGGTGLGLAIVRHVVDNHSGTISVQSVPGEGSTFRIELPMVEV